MTENNNSLTFDAYQDDTNATAIYPGAGFGGADALAYTALGLSGEAGEIANKVKKILRDSGGQVSEQVRADLAKEVGDVLWYVARFADEIGYDLGYLAEENLKKLRSRAERGVISGSGDNR